MKPCFNSLSSRFKLLVWLLNCCVVIELTKIKNLVGKKVVMAGPMMMMPLNSVRRRNQEVPLIFTWALQWKHTTVAVQMTLALTGTHSKALLTISLLTNRYIFTVHLYTVHIKKLCCIC